MRPYGWMCLAVLALPLGARAQESKAKPLVDGSSKLVQTRLNLVLTRYQGEKRLSSRPYAVLAGSEETSSPSGSLFVGSQIPVRTTGANGPTIAFKDVGVKVNGNVRPLGEGRFRVNIKFDDTSVAGDAKSAGREGGDEILRSFASEAVVFLRDGESAPFSSATDPVTGEVVKAEVTLTVLK